MCAKLRILSLILPLMVLTVGCAKDAKSVASPPASSGPPATVQPAAVEPVKPVPAHDSTIQPDRMDARGGTIEALTRKVESYAREFQNQTVRGSAQGPGLPPEPSMVQWVNIDEFHLSPHQGRPMARMVARDDPPAVVRPAIETSSVTANRSESVAYVPAAQGAGSNAAAEVPRHVGTVSPSDSEIVALRQRLTARVKDYPRDIANHLELQLLMFLTDQHVPDMTLLASLAPEDRELLAAIIDGIANFRSAIRADNNMLLSRKVRPIVEMAGRVRAQAELSIPRLALCTRVMGFGVYDPIEPARFAAGREHHAIIYCEVENFASTLGTGGMWETKLTMDIVLYTETGLAVWTDKTETILDQSRARRTDFFVRKMIKLPATLTIGRYLLKVTIIDQQANRVAEASVPIVINVQ